MLPRLLTAPRAAILVVLAAACLLAESPPPPDLDAIRQQPDLKKRYTAALDYASARIDAARKHIDAGQREAFAGDLKEFLAAVRFTDETLRATGKDPSRDSKHFKKAELRMNQFRRRLQSLENHVGLDDRPPVSEARRGLAELHDQLLQDIMGRRK